MYDVKKRGYTSSQSSLIKFGCRNLFLQSIPITLTNQVRLSDSTFLNCYYYFCMLPFSPWSFVKFRIVFNSLRKYVSFFLAIVFHSKKNARRIQKKLYKQTEIPNYQGFIYQIQTLWKLIIFKLSDPRSHTNEPTNRYCVKDHEIVHAKAIQDFPTRYKPLLPVIIKVKQQNLVVPNLLLRYLHHMWSDEMRCVIIIIACIHLLHYITAPLTTKCMYIQHCTRALCASRNADSIRKSQFPITNLFFISACSRII